MISVLFSTPARRITKCGCSPSVPSCAGSSTASVKKAGSSTAGVKKSGPSYADVKKMSKKKQAKAEKNENIKLGMSVKRANESEAERSKHLDRQNARRIEREAKGSPVEKRARRSKSIQREELP